MKKLRFINFSVLIKNQHESKPNEAIIKNFKFINKQIKPTSKKFNLNYYNLHYNNLNKLNNEKVSTPHYSNNVVMLNYPGANLYSQEVKDKEYTMIYVPNMYLNFRIFNLNYRFYDVDDTKLYRPTIFTVYSNFNETKQDSNKTNKNKYEIMLEMMA